MEAGILDLLSRDEYPYGFDAAQKIAGEGPRDYRPEELLMLKKEMRYS
jgi:hypothetical protein